MPVQPQLDVVPVVALPLDPFAQADGKAAANTATLKPNKLRRPTMGNPALNAGLSVSLKPFDVVKAFGTLKFIRVGSLPPRACVKAQLNRSRRGRLGRATRAWRNGRRNRLKICRGQPHAGSSPAARTKSDEGRVRPRASLKNPIDLGTYIEHTATLGHA